MFSSDFNHVEFVDAPGAVCVLEDRLNNARSVPWSDHAARKHPSGEWRTNARANALQYRRFNSDLSATPLRHQPCTGPAGPGTIDAETIILCSMAPPHPLATVPPPLPPGWTEHVGKIPIPASCARP